MKPVLRFTIKYLLGPILAGLVAMVFSHINHEKSSKGYELLAQALNEQVVSHLDSIEHRLDRLESKPASQPINIQRIILPGRVDPLDRRVHEKAAALSSVVVGSKGMTKVASPPAAPVHKSAPHQQLVPPKL